MKMRQLIKESQYKMSSHMGDKPEHVREFYYKSIDGDEIDKIKPDDIDYVAKGDEALQELLISFTITISIKPIDANTSIVEIHDGGVYKRLNNGLIADFIKGKVGK